jgi:NADH-quinone oxidoreductase subunit M
MVLGLGSWFSVSLFVVFFFSFFCSGRWGALRTPLSFPSFLLAGSIFFGWGYFDQLFCISWPNCLGTLVSAGSLYIWLAGLVAFGSFGILGGTRNLAVFYRAGISLVGIFLSGVVLLQASSLLWFFFSFEALLLVSLYLLRITAKTDRVEEAALEMLVWALGSSFGLLLGFGWFLGQNASSFSDLQLLPPSSLPALCILAAFAIKVPMWPAFSWLVRAHVEASVEFSILLSGFIIKVGAWGIYQILFWVSSGFLALCVGSLSIVSVGVAAVRLLAQRDLKRMVAYMTVIETNWLVFCLACGAAPFVHLGLYLTAVHGFTTALGFLFVEVIGRRFQTRDWTQVSGLYFLSPLVWALSFFLLLLLVGFPGTPLFFAKILFLTLLWPYSFFLVFFFSVIFLLLIPLFLFRVWGSM